MVSVREMARRVAGRRTHRLETLPILALQVHSACNCRCVMCDIWKANADKRELSDDELARHVDGLRALHVQRVMLTGGEPLLHSNLWALCGRLRALGIRITLVTTGLLVARHAASIAASIDELVVSIDGPPQVHDAIRRVRGGFERIAHGIGLLNNHAARPSTIARSVVQRQNFAHLPHTIEAIRATGIDRLSFLAADVSSHAFNRAVPWDADRRAEVALSQDQLPLLAAAIAVSRERCADAFAAGFVSGGAGALQRIHDYYRAVAGAGAFPRVECNAPWVSAVLEPGGTLRPCFFHAPYDAGAASLSEVVNSAQATSFRRTLQIATDETCRRCVCSLNLPPWAEA